jgi:hypothetical protein
MSSLEVDPVAIGTGETFGTTGVSRDFLGGLYQGSTLYGAGLDGALVVDTNPFNANDRFGEPLVVANVLQRDASFTDLTIFQECQLELVMPRALYANDVVASLFVSGALLNQGRITATPAAASSFTAAHPVAGLIGGGDAFGADGATGVGTVGSGYGGLGNKGGKGGDSPIHGGAFWQILDPTTASLASSLSYLFMRAAQRAGLGIEGGSGGGSGGGDDVFRGGASGVGGPTVFIAAREFDNTDGIIEIKGGDAGNAEGGNAAGGGGGGGGALIIVTVERPLPADFDGSAGQVTPPGGPFGTVLMTRGRGGLGSGTGAAGDDGEPGIVYTIYAAE